MMEEEIEAGRLGVGVTICGSQGAASTARH